MTDTNFLEEFKLIIECIPKNVNLFIFNFQETNDFTLTCLLRDEFQEREISTWITVIWNHKNGQSFFPMFEKKNKAWFAWIFILANPEEAIKWESVIKISDENNDSALEFRGPVFAIDVVGDEVIKNGKCLAMSDKQIDIMKSTQGIKEEEGQRGFNSKIVITYDVKLKGE